MSGRFSKLETGKARERAEEPERPEPTRAEDSGAESLSLIYDGVLGDAHDLLYQGDWRGALRRYSRAIDLDSTRTEPWLGQVLALIFLGQMREAGTWARRAQECFPEHPTMLSLHGLVISLQGMTKRGLGTLDYAMGLGGAEPICWVARGWALLEAGNRNWETCFAKAAQETRLEDWHTRMLMGLILERYRKWTFAVEQYEAALEGTTSNFCLWLRLGFCRGKLGMARKSLEAYQHSYDINPRCAQAERALRGSHRLPFVALFIRLVRALTFSR